MLEGLWHLAVQAIRHLPQCGRIALLRAGKQCTGKLIELFRAIICDAQRPDQGSSEWLVLIGSAERSSHYLTRKRLIVLHICDVERRAKPVDGPLSFGKHCCFISWMKRTTLRC